MPEGPVIAVLRHADYQQPSGVPSAFLPHPLTREGEEQALRAADLLRDFAVDRGLHLHPRIDSSRMLRAWQTADIIAARLKQLLGQDFSIAEYSELAERSVGAMANLTVDEIENIMALDPRYAAPPSGWKSNSDYCLPYQGAESLNQAGCRVAGHLESVCESMLKEGIDCLKIVVGHGASIRHAALQMGLLTREGVGQVSMYHAVPVYLSRRQDCWVKLAGEWKVRVKDSDGDEIGI